MCRSAGYIGATSIKKFITEKIIGEFPTNAMFMHCSIVCFVLSSSTDCTGWLPGWRAGFVVGCWLAGRLVGCPLPAGWLAGLPSYAIQVLMHLRFEVVYVFVLMRIVFLYIHIFLRGFLRCVGRSHLGVRRDHLLHMPIRALIGSRSWQCFRCLLSFFQLPIRTLIGNCN